MVGDNIGRGEATAFRRVHSIDHVDSKEHRSIIQPLLYIYIYIVQWLLNLRSLKLFNVFVM